jgi:N-acetylglucosaminyldiphosphoundecaprenol N-acetyl-beta-D-mannosaminyltransferase
MSDSHDIATFDVLGTPIAAVEPDDVLGFVDRTIADDGHEYVCVCSVNNVMSAREDDELAEINRGAGLCIPDGFYLAKIGQRRHPGEIERIRGTDLTWRLAEHAADEGYSIFLYGAAPGVPEQMAANLTEHAPRLEIVGTHSPPFRPTTPEEDAEEVAMINEADPDIVLVGLPTPKQDRWMADHVDRVNANVVFGVGAAFDFVAGNKDEAPEWISENGFEWLYRFLQEPTRLWRRVLVQGPKFASLMAADALRADGNASRRET